MLRRLIFKKALKLHECHEEGLIQIKDQHLGDYYDLVCGFCKVFDIVNGNTLMIRDFEIDVYECLDDLRKNAFCASQLTLQCIQVGIRFLGKIVYDTTNYGKNNWYCPNMHHRYGPWAIKLLVL